MNERDTKFPLNLFGSLMLLSLIPFIYTLVRTHLIVNVSVPDGLGIAVHIEWFDLINETIQAFLIVPLYPVFCYGSYILSRYCVGYGFGPYSGSDQIS